MLSCLLLALFFFAIVPAQAQEKLSKEEKKELKELLKKYKKDPLALQELSQSVDMYREQVQDVEAKNNILTSENQMLENKVQQLEQSNMALNNQLATAQDAISQISQENTTMESRGSEDNSMDLMGTLFRVQIGAYQKNYIPEGLDTADGSMTLEQADGMQKVMVGQFRDYQAAKELMGHMKKIGLRDAWVVAYVDGNRVNLNEVVAKEDQ
ncbi:MAG: hypothetical protein KDD15_13525 [Lewinella sp.]|nr:hypothetical protein [Lewinella sp.]